MDHYFGRIDSVINRAYDAQYVQITLYRCAQEPQKLQEKVRLCPPTKVSPGKVSHGV